MIEPSLLMRLARDYADRKMKERPTLRAIVLAGSVARGEPALGDAVDLDILLIDDAPPEPERDLARLSEFVFVDAAYLRTADLSDRKALRAHHFLAPLLNEALILHDPRHYFDILQASVRAPYNRPDNIYARARSALAPALRQADQFALWREDPPADGPAFDDLTALRQSLYLVAHSIILLSGQPGDAAGPRKFMARYEAAARRHNADLYPLFLQALGIEGYALDDYDSLIAQWLALYKSVSPRADDPLIHPYKRGYYERGFRALAAEGHALNTLWLFEHTLAACARLSDPAPDLWQRHLALTGKADTAGFIDRLRAFEQLATLADETMTGWARRENVEW